MVEAGKLDRLRLILDRFQIVDQGLPQKREVLGRQYGAGACWFPPLELPGLAATVIAAAVGGAIGRRLLPAGALLGPMLLGAGLSLAFGVRFALPGWLLAPAYAVVGWGIGRGNW